MNSGNSFDDVTDNKMKNIRILETRYTGQQSRQRSVSGTIEFRSPASRDKFHGGPDSAAYREQLNYY